MPAQAIQKKLTNDDVSKIKYVQNISGGILRLPDLSEDGEEGKGVTLDVDEVLELASVVSEKAKVRSRDLKKALQAWPATRSFDGMPALLKVVEGFGDSSLTATAVTGSLIPLTGSHQAAPGHFDIKQMEAQLEEMVYDLKSTKQAGQKAMLQAGVDALKKRIEEAKKTTKIGLASNVVVLTEEQKTKSIL